MRRLLIQWRLLALPGCFLVLALIVLVLGNRFLRSKLLALGVSSEPPSREYRIVPVQSVKLIVEPDDGMTELRSRIDRATKSIDIVMYELEDQETEEMLTAAAGRGVSVRVLLNGGLYGKGSKANQAAFTYLQAHGVQVKWSPSYFALTHQKTAVIDSSNAIILTFNFTSTYYDTGRDFGIEDTDPTDVSAIEAVFTADWNAVQISPGNGDDLVWSPGSKQILLAMIASAHTSLLIYTEEIEDADVIKAIAAACGRGVHVQIVMTNNKKWYSAFIALAAAGANVRIYAPKAPLYIHAKMIIADNTQAFIGSENLTTSSLLENRELGLFISTPSVVATLEKVFASDWNGAS